MVRPAFSQAAVAVAALAWSLGASAASLVEGFDVVPVPGWTTVNNSQPIGTTSYFQGNPDVFSAFSGAANSYVGVNFNSGGGTAEISNWLITPTLSFSNGDVVSFYTRTVQGSIFPDRLQLRFSTVGGTDVGTTTTSEGTFTTLLLDINPSLAVGGYPEDWTQYSVTLSGLGGPTSGALAFRYLVSDGGPAGNNSNYIGIDSLTITAVPEPTTWLLMGLGLGALALRRKPSV
jgi:PEP-CTERM motif